MKEAFSLPNILSYIRIALVPIFVILFFNVSEYFALGVFVLASLTDVVDGFVARKFKLTTNIGKVLDPFADKLLKLTVLGCLAIKLYIPLWFVAVMIILDLILIISAIVLFKREVIIKSNAFGKSGTAIIFVGVILSFFVNYLTEIGLNNLHLYVLYLGLLIVFASAISYLVVYIKIKAKNKG